MKLNKEITSRILGGPDVLSIHKVALLDKLNNATTEGLMNYIIDDPSKFPNRMGIGIGRIVAERIVKKRESLGGFTSLEDLIGIKGFGEDKFNDLVYTMVKRRHPFPSGLGADFDYFLKAIGDIEYSFSGSKKKLLSHLRKIASDGVTGAKLEFNLNWEEIIPDADDTPDFNPGHWSPTRIREKQEISIRSTPLNVHTLLAGLDAKYHDNQLNLINGELILAKNISYASYLNPLSFTALAYITSREIDLSAATPTNKDEFTAAFFESMPLGRFYGLADAYAIELDASRSLVSDLLFYYTEDGSPIKERFTPFLRSIRLNSLRGSTFTGDTPAFRQNLQREVVLSYVHLGQQNGRMAQEKLDVVQERNTAVFTNLTAVSSFSVDTFIDVLAVLVASEKSKPTILSWNRLESRTRTDDFTRPLFAEIRDPLWMLGRQYQLGEFRGEDAGSAIETRVKMKTSKLDRIGLGRNSVQSYSDELPLEMVVERQAAPLDIMVRLEIGKKWEDMIREFGDSGDSLLSESEINELLLFFRGEEDFQFESPDQLEDSVLTADPNYLATVDFAKATGMIDGFKLYQKIESGIEASDSTAGIIASLDNVATKFLEWVEAEILTVYQPIDSAWEASFLEYQFACSAPKSASASTVLGAEEYASGDLDWYNFDILGSTGRYSNGLRAPDPDTSLLEETVLTSIPAILTYPGMPLPRWWQMEDYAVNFDQLVVNKADAATLAFAEFATIYSNDWMVIPFDVKAGSICEIESMIVKDVFGQYTSIKPAGSGNQDDWERWAMFDLHQRSESIIADHQLFVSPTLVKVMEGEAIEKVNFLRDEMANMVWGIELSVPNGLGNGVDGYEAALKYQNDLKSLGVVNPVEGVDEIENEANIRYQLGSEVPENWIPFIPVRRQGTNTREIWLRRAAMPRIIPNQEIKRVRPRTEILRQNYDAVEGRWSPYYINEEEITRAGTIVSKNWQRARWYNGVTVWWLGSRKQTGRGQANSGLVFDAITPIK